MVSVSKWWSTGESLPAPEVPPRHAPPGHHPAQEVLPAPFQGWGQTAQPRFHTPQQCAGYLGGTLTSYSTLKLCSIPQDPGLPFRWPQASPGVPPCSRVKRTGIHSWGGQPSVGEGTTGCPADHAPDPGSCWHFVCVSLDLPRSLQRPHRPLFHRWAPQPREQLLVTSGWAQSQDLVPGPRTMSFPFLNYHLILS